MNINLFRIFDSSTSIRLSLNWFSSIYLLILLPNLYWILISLYTIFLKVLLILLNNEFKILIKLKINKINLIILISLFIIIILNNLIGLYSYIFTSSRHLIFSLTFSIIIWISFILFGWIKNFNNIFIHLVPQGTPNVLIPFIVLIETIRNLILPWTLAILLRANIIAGHLLITLIRNNGNKLIFFILFLILIIQNLLIILELAVSIIQAYVFTVLTTLYLREIN